MSVTSERTFEEAIASHLLAYGYTRGEPGHFDAAHALDPTVLFAFIEATQLDEWARLNVIHGAATQDRFVARLVQERDRRGTLDVLRHGITDHGVRFRLAYFRPASGRNPEAAAQCARNVFTVTRQVHYHTRDRVDSLDMVLSLNGLPVVTAELKNPLTGQTAADAVRQYHARDAREPTLRFKSGALVHFAVDPDEVRMTTRLAGTETRFLPFNRGNGTGAGNPPDPARGYRTAYLWHDVWERESLLDLVGRFLHLEETRDDVGRVVAEAIIFPRYHQLDAVRKLVMDARRRGAGGHYLIQHSAGSGKSNTIAWLAHRLSDLHDATDGTVFDSVIVITDRKVLDRQLQDTVYQFEHQTGVVQKIDENAAQLAEALRDGTRIVITTLQKFPFVLDAVRDLPGRRYAAIVDEAHSSQTGDAALAMQRALATPSLEAAAAETAASDAADEARDPFAEIVRGRGRPANVSFFAFTATPKGKTLELFGTPDIEGIPRPFHLYAMRQAIEEGFILDVLRGYTTYTRYFRLTQHTEADPQVDRTQAARAAVTFVGLHPHNIVQKTRVVVEHYRQYVRRQLSGNAKAMLVTPSRLHAVKYKQAIDAYLTEQGYTDVRVIVAFSGVVTDEQGVEYTEPQMNGFGEREVPEKLASPGYQLLIVADKYQTGFDQPLLTAMYVDKRLAGLRAVQTLSRINRPTPGKDGTVVLDFANDPEEIRAAFQQYYEEATLDETTDPNRLYDLASDLDDERVYHSDEIEQFAAVFFAPPNRRATSDQAYLNRALNPAVDRFRALSVERREEFRHTLAAFVRLYAFLCQLVPFADADLEKRYAFGRMLLRKLPRRDGGEDFALDDDVALQYYRLTKIAEQDLALTVGVPAPLRGPASVGAGEDSVPDHALLSAIIETINTRFGTNFTETDRLLVEQIEADLVADATLARQAQTNTEENFRYGFDDVFEKIVMDRAGRNSAFFTQLLDNEAFQQLMREYLQARVYEQLHNHET